MTADREFPSPTQPAGSRKDVFLRYLAYFRGVLVAKVDGLPDSELRSSRLPSGWTPVELVKHLTYVEMRWLEWGFEGKDVDDPWGDSRDHRWHVGQAETVQDVLVAFGGQAARTEAVVARHDLDETGAPGERWEGEPPPTLERILFHLLQEYARHVGHLDIVRELADGTVGE